MYLGIVKKKVENNFQRFFLFNKVWNVRRTENWSCCVSGIKQHSTNDLPKWSSQIQRDQPNSGWICSTRNQTDCKWLFKHIFFSFEIKSIILLSLKRLCTDTLTSRLDTLTSSLDTLTSRLDTFCVDKSAASRVYQIKSCL